MLLTLGFAVSNIVVARFMAGKRWRVAAVLHGVLFGVVAILLLLLNYTVILCHFLNARELEILRSTLNITLSGVNGFFPPILVMEGFIFVEMVFSTYLVTDKVSRCLRRGQPSVQKVREQKKVEFPKYQFPRFCGSILKLNCVMIC